MRPRILAVWLLALLVVLAHAPSTYAGAFYQGTPLTLADGSKIIPGGYRRDDFYYTWAVVRLGPSGAYDPAFNGGAVTVPIFHYYEFAHHVAVQDDGKIVVAGMAADPSRWSGGKCYPAFCANYIALARLNSDGTLDPSFNDNGRLVLDIGGANSSDDVPDYAYVDGLEIGAGGEITVFGANGASVARVRSNGSVDETFATSFRPREFRPAQIVVLEAYNAALDHYFLTWQPDEIESLSAGASIKGWVPTGKSFNVYAAPQAGTSPVCRFYLPPRFGDSHYFGRGQAECDATAAAHPEFILESPAFMYVALPDNGVCPAETIPVYRLFDNRAGANHRYTTEIAVRDAMVAKGWVAEGDGPDYVAMCGPRP